MHLKQPFFKYGANVYLEPATGPEGERVIAQVERFDNVSASGKKMSYEVGGRDLFEVTFRWQTDAQKTLWLAFWDSVKGGDPFWYVVDDSVERYGSGTKYGSGLKYGQDSDDNAITETQYTLENIEFPIEQEDVYGYWRVGPLQMREVV